MFSFTNVDFVFAFLLSQFVCAEFDSKHIYWGDSIFNIYCHLGSGSIRSFDWECAGIRKPVSLNFYFKTNFSWC